MIFINLPDFVMITIPPIASLSTQLVVMTIISGQHMASVEVNMHL